jgi:tetratricopeptide (TPR) repeat protein
MRYLLLLTLSGLLAVSGFGQDDVVFAFVQNKSGKVGLGAATTYKYDVTNAVFQTLLRTRGDIHQVPPALVMNNGEQYIAWMNPTGVQIGLEERAYDVCAALGADSLNALAVLLAHELTHYYEKHDWNRNFAHANQHTAAARHVHTTDESVLQETQADYMGGFLAFSAGYNGYGLMPSLLTELYNAYGLPEAVPGYPALQERVELSRIAMEKLRDLQTVFSTARFLSQLENYEAAAQYYRFIQQDYQSREVYNNTGVNLALEALSYFGETEMPYVMPFELDPNSRLNALKGVLADRIKIREALLRQAIDQFDKTIALDPAYTAGYLNKASAYALMGAWEDAQYWIGKGRRSADAGYTDFLVLEGVAAALQADTASAHKLLTEAKSKSSTLADINLAILTSRTPLPRV